MCAFTPFLKFLNKLQRRLSYKFSFSVWIHKLSWSLAEFSPSFCLISMSYSFFLFLIVKLAEATRHTCLKQVVCFPHWANIVLKGIPVPSPPPFLRHPPPESAYPLSLNFCIPSPLFCSTPFSGILDSSLSLAQTPPALNRSTNLLWLKQISKRWFYQFSCRFLSKIQF